MQFYETVMGNRFFTAQLPQLISTGKELNKKLDELAKVIQTSATGSKDNVGQYLVIRSGGPTINCAKYNSLNQARAKMREDVFNFRKKTEQEEQMGVNEELYDYGFHINYTYSADGYDGNKYCWKIIDLQSDF